MKWRPDWNYIGYMNSFNNQQPNTRIDAPENQQFERDLEQFLYEFDKAITAILDSPGKPLDDWLRLSSFVSTMVDNNLNISMIRGFENKQRFEQMLSKTKNILIELEKTPEVRGHFQKEKQEWEEAVKLRRKLLLFGALFLLILLAMWFGPKMS